MDQQERGRGEVKDVAVPSVAGAVASQEPVIPPMPAVHHPWLLFPPALPVRVLMLYITRLIEYLPKEIEAAHYLDWDMLSTMQVDRSFNHFLTQRELVLEFVSTVTFDYRSTDFSDPTVLTFRLGGEDR
ncbi:hypothetical protein Tco_0694505 [Tanacetum coccineum]